MKPLAPILVLAALACGCTSPSAFSGVAPKVIAGSLLTYVDGDEQAGTTTFASLPLLTYRETREAPGRLDTTTCVVPFLFHFQETTKEIRVVREEARAECPDDEPDPLAPPPRKAPPRKRARAKIKEAQPEASSKEKARAGISLSRPDRGRELPIRRARSRPKAASPPAARERRAAQKPNKAKKSKTKKAKARPELEFVIPTRSPARWEGVTLTLPAGAEVTKHRYPARSGELNVFFPLFRVAREIPGRAIVRHRGSAKVYEVGPQSTKIRVLPLFSHTRTRKLSQTILWPLLGFGWETTAKGTYVRLFYFLRFKVD